MRNRGLTQQEAAEIAGCHCNTVVRFCRRHGIGWPNRACFQPSVLVEVAGERMTLREAADRYGFERMQIYDRYKRGARGRDLVKPMRSRPAPEYYPLGFDSNDWKHVTDVALKVSPKAAAGRFGIPLGAVMAAVRGEEERLG